MIDEQLDLSGPGKEIHWSAAILFAIGFAILWVFSCIVKVMAAAAELFLEVFLFCAIATVVVIFFCVSVHIIGVVLQYLNII
jgi:hypothetical protein